MAKPQTQKSYRYTGPVTPLDIEGEKTRMLHPGVSYTDLPEEHPIVANLIARLVLVAETDAAVAPADASEGA